jgi:hypothetical protein
MYRLLMVIAAYIAMRVFDGDRRPKPPHLRDD